MTPPITHDVDRGRFHTSVDGLHGECDYVLADGVMHLVHTAVDPALQGRGVAAALVAAALAHARTHGLRIRPACSYVRTYLRRNPRELDLLAP